MNKITQTVTLILFLTFFNVFSQQEVRGNREGTIFYPTINRATDAFNISVELFELGSAKYVEAELYDENEVKLISKLYKLISRNKKYYTLDEEGVEKEVSIYDIKFNLQNTIKDLNYPKVKINILNNNYQIIDFSQKIFY